MEKWPCSTPCSSTRGSTDALPCMVEKAMGLTGLEKSQVKEWIKDRKRNDRYRRDVDDPLLHAARTIVSMDDPPTPHQVEVEMERLLAQQDTRMEDPEDCDTFTSSRGATPPLFYWPNQDPLPRCFQGLPWKNPKTYLLVICVLVPLESLQMYLSIDRYYYADDGHGSTTNPQNAREDNNIIRTTMLLRWRRHLARSVLSRLGKRVLS